MRHDIRKTDRVYGIVKNIVIRFASRNGVVRSTDISPPLKLAQANRNLYHMANKGLLRKVKDGRPGRDGVPAVFKLAK